MNCKLKYKLYEEYSNIIMPKLKNTYDIIFIDGSHDEKIVILDLINGNNNLLVNGLMILDDVLHKGVKNAILAFFKKYKNYKRISIVNNNFFIEQKLYDTNSIKKSFNNPNTMFCFIKIF